MTLTANGLTTDLLNNCFDTSKNSKKQQKYANEVTTCLSVKTRLIYRNQSTDLESMSLTGFYMKWVFTERYFRIGYNWHTKY